MEGLYCLENLENSGGDNFFCNQESNTQSYETLVAEDPRISQDQTVLDNLLALQYSSMPSQDYCSHIQTNIQPFMRQIVTNWMLEVR